MLLLMFGERVVGTIVMTPTSFINYAAGYAMEYKHITLEHHLDLWTRGYDNPAKLVWVD